MSDDTTPADDQAAIDETDAAAGFRSVVDDGDLDDLPHGDPNLACAQGDYDHLNHVGDPVDDDGGVGAALARLDAGGGSV